MTRRRQLATPLALHDVHDVEDLVNHVTATAAITPRNPTDREDLTAYLIGEAWIASQDYDPTRTGTFRAYLARILHQRCIDWARRNIGDPRSPQGIRPTATDPRDLGGALTIQPEDPTRLRATDVARLQTR